MRKKYDISRFINMIFFKCFEKKKDLKFWPLRFSELLNFE